MKHRVLRYNDCAQYCDDLFQCFKDNPQILDEESIDYFESLEKSVNYVSDLIDSPDSMVVGIFDDEEEFLYGIIIYDQMRFSLDGNSAQLHIATSKDIWGKDFLELYKDMIAITVFHVLYCMIPAKCRATIGFVKSLGFEKTGYIPKAIPYRNRDGTIKMYDELIYTLVKNES